MSGRVNPLHGYAKTLQELIGAESVLVIAVSREHRTVFADSFGESGGASIIADALPQYVTMLRRAIREQGNCTFPMQGRMIEVLEPPRG